MQRVPFDLFFFSLAHLGGGENKVGDGMCHALEDLCIPYSYEAPVDGSLEGPPPVRAKIVWFTLRGPFLVSPTLRNRCPIPTALRHLLLAFEWKIVDNRTV